VETGNGGVTVNRVDTQYGACACSPLGKVSAVSQPYAPGGQVYWTRYGYDARGRTVTVTAPDGSVSRTSYVGNQATVTGVARGWKTTTEDAFGNLASVVEPDTPHGVNNTTTYTYNGLNQLTGVTMYTAAGTQQRSFSYSGTDLASATNPENGTVQYQYDEDGKGPHLADDCTWDKS
jgi:YD repeat-containing protein